MYCWRHDVFGYLLLKIWLVALTQLLMQAGSIRQTCSAALVAFLLDYPLGPRRVQAHFTFLLSNVQVQP